MDLRNILRNKIIDEVLDTDDNAWRVFIYDMPVAKILASLFKRSELLSHNLVSMNRIEEERADVDFPAVYFVECNKEASKMINDDHSSHKYSSISVVSLIRPDGLDSMIPFKVIMANIEVLEQRVFVCKPEQLALLCRLLSVSCDIKYLPLSKSLAENVSNNIKNLNMGLDEKFKQVQHSASIILFDRSVDLYTPFLHFYTFRTIMNEMKIANFKENQNDDPLWNELAYKHLAEVSDILKKQINKLNRNMEQLKGRKMDTDSLGKMVFEAPQTIEMKDAIAKYSSILSTAFERLEYLKELTEAEQSIATDYDKNGKKRQESMELLLKILKSTRIPIADRLRLLYVMKVKGISMTPTEMQILETAGFEKEDLSLKIDSKNNMGQSSPKEYEYDISRYEPVLNELVIRHVNGEPIFQGLSNESSTDTSSERATSLRRSKMLTQNRKKAKNILIIYISGGCTFEERRIAYLLSEKLGIDIFIGSDKMIKPDEFITMLKSSHLKKN